MAYLKAELSPKNKYYISKHRYYELKHFCMQYKEWKDMLMRINEYPEHFIKMYSEYSQNSDPTARVAVLKADLERNIKMIEDTAAACDEVIGPYVLKAVTEDIPFVTLQMIYDIPCGKDMYYDRYRKFYWMLSEIKS